MRAPPWILFATAVIASAASAQPAAPAPEPPVPERPTTPPWAIGVSDGNKQQAQALLERGNTSFLANQYLEALDAYQQAVAAWDHPAIRFNIVRVLIQLDRPVEAFENLEKSLAYGAAPLEDTVYAEAKNYQSLLRGQIADLDVSCAQAGVKVSVDGKDLLTCPGAQRTRVRPGTHKIVGEKAGLLTSAQEVAVFAGDAKAVRVELLAPGESTITTRRWQPWKPWAVAGSGAFVAAVGGLLQLSASSSMDRYHAELRTLCGTPGCITAEIPSSTADLRSSAERNNKIAIAAMAVGGAALITGAVLVVLNQPRTVEVEPSPTRVTTFVTPDGAGIAVGGTF